jgi:NADPH-dependent 7-cyano-7-deazaguanine reductase QueF
VGETFNLLDFKKYITSLRSQKFYAEDIAFEIHQTITKAIDTQALGVVVDLSARGGLQQRIAYGREFQVTQKENIFQI